MNHDIASSFPEIYIMRLGWTLVHSLWQGGIIAALLFLVLWAVHSPTQRHLACVLTLLAMFVCPVVTFRSTAASRVTMLVSPSAESQAGAEDNKEMQPSASGGFHAVRDHRFNLERWLPWLVAAWIAGVVLLSICRLTAWLWWRRRILKHSRTVGAELQHLLRSLCTSMGIRRAVRVMECARAATPMLMGFFRPVILLPASVITGLEPRQLEAVLAHELAHLRRCDALVLWLQNFAEALFFYHPATWWISRRLRIEREHCCDDLALARGTDRVALAQALGKLAQWDAARSMTGSLAITGHMPVLERVRRLVAVPVESTQPYSWSAAFLTSAGVIGLLLFLMVPVKQAHAAADSPEFKAQGKIVATLMENDEGKRAAFYGTQKEILESGELKRRALEGVRGLHPELKESSVEVQVSIAKGSSILNVAVIGAEQKYIRVYLDALLDEFMAFRMEMVEKSMGIAMNKVIAEVLLRAKSVKEKAQQLSAFKRAHPGDFDSGPNRAEYSILESEFKREDQDYQKWKTVLEKLDQALKTQNMQMAIMERPAKAEKVK